MSHCETLPKCASRKLKCQRPNSWTVFMMAHSRRLQTIENGPVVDKDAKLKVKAARYRELSMADAILFFDRDGHGARRTDNAMVCKVYRQLKNITFAPVLRTLPPSTASTALVLPTGSAATISWADRAVVRLDDLPTHFNRVYGFSSGSVRRLRAETNVTDVKRLHMPVPGGMISESWFNDSIMNGFMSLLWSSCPARGAMILESQVFASNVKGGATFEQARGLNIIKNARSACGMAASNSGPSVRVTLFPYNLGSCHWILMAFDHTIQSWHSYDSYGGHHASVARRFHAHLFRNMNLPKPLKFEYKKKEIPQQNDAFQCGVWTCMSALCLVTNKHFPKHAFSTSASTTAASAYSMAARIYIAKTMFTNSITLVVPPNTDLQSIPWKKH